ncbi:MAG: hypothetical protein Rubg2KO_24440 [Rubricoccaceae bacterium]
MSDSLVPSGLKAVDARWGGLAANGAYLLVGRAGGGRSALALQFVRGAVDSDARCLLISPRPPEELVHLASTVGLNLGDAHKTGRLRLLRIPSADALAQRGSDSLDKAYQDFVKLIRTDRPDRVVIEDFTPLVQFDSFERFETAFSTLATDIGELGAALVVGLGEPANSTSRQLLDVVKRHVNASIELDAESRQIRLTKQDAASLDMEPVASAPPAPVANSPAGPSPQGATEPAASSTATPAEAAEEPAVPEPPPAPEPVVPEPPPEPIVQAVPTATIEEEAPIGTAAEAPDNDAEKPEPHLSLAPEPEAEPEPEAPASEASGYPVAGVTSAPPAEPSLHGEPEDPFGVDPDSVLSHGYLVDSGAIVPPERPTEPPPAFESLGSQEATDPADAFRAALDSSFAVRVTGTPFLVVAVRMEPSAPESVYFPTVAEGLRGALRPQDHILVDENRHRAVVLLPASQADAAQKLFSGLQTHLRRSLDDAAAGVLRAVGAVSVPDGQPFTSSRDLMAYAYED